MLSANARSLLLLACQNEYVTTLAWPPTKDGKLPPAFDELNLAHAVQIIENTDDEKGVRWRITSAGLALAAKDWAHAYDQANKVKVQYENRCLNMAAALYAFVHGKRTDGTSLSFQEAVNDAKQLLGE